MILFVVRHTDALLKHISLTLLWWNEIWPSLKMGVGGPRPSADCLKPSTAIPHSQHMEKKYIKHQCGFASKIKLHVRINCSRSWERSRNLSKAAYIWHQYLYKGHSLPSLRCGLNTGPCLLFYQPGLHAEFTTYTLHYHPIGRSMRAETEHVIFAMTHG